ncbi:Heterokaryon incompatibility protein (HET) domain containing protein [Naviculisporaceae sp. PSN 640]
MAHDSLSSENREIRVAELFPKCHSRPFPDSDLSSPIIQISLRKVSLNDSPLPEYTALSYVWGDPNDTIPILVNGVDFAATKNLVSALRALQHDEEIVTLWVDAICIKQSDNEEKSWQIQLMKQIFQGATCTVVWLGDAADGSDYIMEVIADLAGHPAVQAGSWLSFYTETRKELSPSIKMILQDPRIPTDFSHPALNSFLTSFIALVKREYWFRVWCLQEISVCSDTVVVCGNNGRRVDVDAFETIVCCYCAFVQWGLEEAAEELPKPGGINLLSVHDFIADLNLDRGAMRMLRMRAAYRTGQGRARQDGHLDEGGLRSRNIDDPSDGFCNPLIHFLSDAFTSATGDVSATLRSTDPRDMIYGLLGLAGDVEELRVVPDYEKPCEQVFLETWSALLRKHGAHLLVWAAPTGTHEGRAMINDPFMAPPSWVADWRHPRLSHIFWHLDWFLACGPEHRQTQWVHNIFDDPRSISLKGVRVDVVQDIGTTFHPVQRFERSQSFQNISVLIKEVTQFLRESASSPTPVYETQEAIHSARWRIPVCDVELTETTIRRATVASEEAFHSLLTDLECCEWNETPDAVKRGEFGKLRDGAYMSIMFVSPYARPFLTLNGWVGRGPEGLRKGDIIVILWGCRILLVLRPCGVGDEEKYQLVGDAYVHGLMDGEFFQGGVERQEEVFCLV